MTLPGDIEALALLERVLSGHHRSAANRARDEHRHPRETLLFFGIRPNSVVVEFSLFWRDWYTEILAPHLKESGMLYAATGDPAPDSPYDALLKKLLAARPELYGKVEQIKVEPGRIAIAPEGSVDLVLTSRSIHSWIGAGLEKAAFETAFRALKPGGVLGVEQHRHNDPRYKPKQGEAYVGEDYAISLIEAAGFKLVERSDINCNPKDTKDYPKGVWCLPPVYALGETDREKYAAIGESDRFTLKFIEPSGTDGNA